MYYFQVNCCFYLTVLLHFLFFFDALTIIYGGEVCHCSHVFGVLNIFSVWMLVYFSRFEEFFSCKFIELISCAFNFYLSSFVYVFDLVPWSYLRGFGCLGHTPILLLLFRFKCNIPLTLSSPSSLLVLVLALLLLLLIIIIIIFLIWLFQLFFMGPLLFSPPFEIIQIFLFSLSKIKNPFSPCL